MLDQQERAGMCGIAGIYRRRNLDESDPLRLQAMTDAIVHRGPDDFGYLLLDGRNGSFQIGQAGFDQRPCDVCLGNRRLTIIDLSPNGRQPIHNETSEIFIDGEGCPRRQSCGEAPAQLWTATGGTHPLVVVTPRPGGNGLL